MNNNQMLQRAEKLAAEMQTGIYAGRAQIVYSYGCYGYTRGGGATWHGGLDLVGLDDEFIRMPPYKGRKEIQGTVTRARIVTDHNDKTWEWGYYICVQLDAGQTPDEINFLYFCHCKELLVQAGQKVRTGDILAIVGQTGNAAGGYDHCHFEARATASGTGLDPTDYSGTDNAVGIYGSVPTAENPARDLSTIPNSQLDEIQLVTIGPLTAAQMQEVDALAVQQGLSEDRYQVMTAGEGYKVAVLSVSSGDAMQYMALAQRNGWDKLQRYDSRFVG
ncbi:MAG: peptidase M23 [Subdoligranulum variabile]|nr:MAG: peptidase M23 [Subdoligranulum variabile]